MKEPSQRVKDILAKMTLEEKAIQVSCIVPSMSLNKGVFDPAKAAEEMPYGVGRMTQFASGFVAGPKQAAEGANAIQKYCIEKTGLPAIFQNESSSGLVAAEGTIFPVPVALASSFDPELSYQMGKVIGDEGKAIGAKVMMSPVADVSRDARWGRVDETFGEDPLMCARFTSEEVRGIQGDDYTQRCSALAKHWVAYGASEGGTNCATINIGKKEIFEVYATPFAAAIKENDMQGVMVTYSDIDGYPMSVNPEYTQKMLREDLGFNGIAVCDGHSIPRVIQTQGMYEDRAELAGQALLAGIDSDTPTTTVYNHIVEGVRKGVVSEEALDLCVLRTLQQREEMGMLDDPFVDPEKAQAVFDDPAADALSAEIAQKAVVLLKNNNILPLKPETKKIAVVGPFAESISGFFGGYAYPAMMGSFLQLALEPNVGAAMEGFQEMVHKMFDIPTMQAKMIKDPSKSFLENFNDYLRDTLGTVSLAEAMREAFPNAEIVSHVGVKNTPTATDWKETIAEAKQVAAGADVIILAVGEITGQGEGATSGEGVNNPDLKLPFHQEDLVAAMHELGIPSVLALYNGRAMALGNIEPMVDAIVEAWYPGPAGGKTVAKVVSGEVNPSGKLPVTFPQISSQCPIYYGHLTGSGYMTIRQTPDPSVMQPLYPFGYGLSYTTFAVSNLVADASVATGDTFKVSVDVENTGSVAGTEVVQIYTHSLQPTVIRPIKELRGFKRVDLQPGEKKTVEFTFDTRAFGYLNRQNDFVIEPRPQAIYAGTDSSRIQAQAEISFTGEVKEILHDRVFNFEAVIR